MHTCGNKLIAGSRSGSLRSMGRSVRIDGAGASYRMMSRHVSVLFGMLPDRGPKRSASGMPQGAKRGIAACQIAVSIAWPLLAGCGGAPAVDVTGANGQDVTWQRDQSETAVNVSNVPYAKQIITVTYNDDTKTEKTIIYGSNSRLVLPGASLMGWSNSLDGGTTWSYGGKVAPPNGWPVLWGDPSLATDFLDQRYVFMANLAVPAAKMPAGGINGPLNPISGAAYLGGACIARSQDGGLTFGVAQCVSSNNDFYDGSSLVAAGSPYDRSVFAAFRDVDKNRIDVYMSPTPTGQFQQLANPFPGIPIGSHPRLRYDATTGSLYVAALGAIDNKIYVNRYVSDGWRTPVVASIQTAGKPDIQLSDRVLRTGYQFSFDIGNPSAKGGDDLRFAYTAFDQQSNRYYIRGSYCSSDLSGGCRDAPEWGTTPGNLSLTGDQFHPYVRAFTGFVNLAPVWKLAYTTREDDPSGNTVSVREGNLDVLGDGTRVFVPHRLPGGLLVCPDSRGYWGDYNELQFAGIDQNLNPLFMLTFTDSSQGCVTRWDYTSHHVHVTSVVFP